MPNEIRKYINKINEKDYLFEQIKKVLDETLSNVDDDVNKIYDLYFRKTIDNIKRTGIVNVDNLKESETDTSILSNPLSVKAHEINPCKIIINTGKNFYNPFVKVISLSLSGNAISYADDYGGNIEKASETLNFDDSNSFKHEFDEHRVKGSIHHELSHWIDDTINNAHIKTMLDKYNKSPQKRPKNIGISSTHEMHAIIHNIKQLYNLNKEKWDDYSFNDLINHIPPLYASRKVLSEDEFIEFKKALKKRLFREKLLGKNMINT